MKFKIYCFYCGWLVRCNCQQQNRNSVSTHGSIANFQEDTIMDKPEHISDIEGLTKKLFDVAAGWIEESEMPMATMLGCLDVVKLYVVKKYDEDEQ